MKIITKNIELATKGNIDIIDITYQVKEKLRQTKLEDGIVTIFIPGSTAAITTMEFESGQIEDLKETIDRLIPKNKTYAHNHSMSGSDGNAHSHLRASLFQADITVPFKDSELLLGTWQQIVFIDFDIYPRNRSLVLQFIGE